MQTNTPVNIVHQQLTQILRERGIRLSDVSREIGCSYSSLSYWYKKVSGTKSRKVEKKVEKWIYDQQSSTLKSIKLNISKPSSNPMKKKQNIIKDIPLQPLLPMINILHRTQTLKKSIPSSSSTNRMEHSISSYEIPWDELKERQDLKKWSRKRKREPIPKSIEIYQKIKSPKLYFHPELIPIRFDIDLNGTRFQDFILWNTNEEFCSPQQYAIHLVKDYKLEDQMKDAIAESLQRQIDAYQKFYLTTKAGESIHPITIDLRINNFVFHDQFEWDILNLKNSPQLFASKICSDLNLPSTFYSILVFTIYEQIMYYRQAILYPNIHLSKPLQNKQTYCIQSMPSINRVLRTPLEIDQWQPVLSQLSSEEMFELEEKHKNITSIKSQMIPPIVDTCIPYFREEYRPPSKEIKGPKPINAFIAFCSAHRTDIMNSTSKRSAGEVTKILAEMWRNTTEKEKEEYTVLADIENDKRQQDFLLEQKAKEISQWEEQEIRRKGLISNMILEATPEHCKNIFLQEYMRQRHDMNRIREKY